LGLVCTLVRPPRLLLLDEPTVGVDPLARREFWAQVNSLAEQGVTVLVTNHFMEEAENCDRLAIMAEGRVLAEGTPEDMKARHGGPAGRAATMEDAFVHPSVWGFLFPLWYVPSSWPRCICPALVIYVLFIIGIGLMISSLSTTLHNPCWGRFSLSCRR
jgi:hypothetical protein